MRITWHTSLILALLLLTPGTSLQAKQRFVPPPLRVYIPFDAAWEGIHRVFEERSLEERLKDRGKGFVVSEFREYISGPLTASHLAKIGEKPKLLDGFWVKVEYQFEILVELVTEREIIVTANANIRALKRDLLGQETWVDILTNGELEAGFLTEFGESLFGESFSLDAPKRGFWEREPTYVPDMEERIPKIPGPERP